MVHFLKLRTEEICSENEIIHDLPPRLISCDFCISFHYFFTQAKIKLGHVLRLVLGCSTVFGDIWLVCCLPFTALPKARKPPLLRYHSRVPFKSYLPLLTFSQLSSGLNLGKLIQRSKRKERGVNPLFHHNPHAVQQSQDKHWEC